jgi:hypothetical protein
LVFCLYFPGVGPVPSREERPGENGDTYLPALESRYSESALEGSFL